MTDVGLEPYLFLGAVLFVCGAVCMATKRNAIGVLIGVAVARTRVLQPAVCTPRHPGARLPPSGRTRRRRTGAPPAPSVPPTRLGAPLIPPSPGLTTV